MGDTTIYLVRHTQTVGNIEKRLTGRGVFEITEKGKEYVQKLEKRFEKIKINKVYSSPSPRAIKTVQGIAEEKGLEIIQDESLYEMYFGIYDGWKWEDVDKINPKIHKLHEQTNQIMKIPEQETTEEVAKRMYDGIQKIAENNLEKNILIASHGVAIEAFLRTVTNEPFENLKEEYSQHNTSVNELIYDASRKAFKLLKLNDITHLLKSREED